MLQELPWFIAVKSRGFNQNLTKNPSHLFCRAIPLKSWHPPRLPSTKGPAILGECSGWILSLGINLIQGQWARSPATPCILGKWPGAASDRSDRSDRSDSDGTAEWHTRPMERPWKTWGQLDEEFWGQLDEEFWDVNICQHKGFAMFFPWNTNHHQPKQCFFLTVRVHD